MTTKTMTALFSSYGVAAQAVSDLENSGVAHDDISIVSNNKDEQSVTSHHDTHYPSYDRDHKAVEGSVVDVAADEEPSAGTGAIVGTTIGGLAGLLTGLGMLAIPGIGPVVAAGWLVATITGAGIGAGAGGLVGGLISSGETEENATYYSKGVESGGAIVTVKASEEQAALVANLLRKHGGSTRSDWSLYDTHSKDGTEIIS